MPIRGLLFDKDGTLLDYHASWMPLNRRAALHAAGGDRTLADRLLLAGGYDAGTDRIRANTPLAAGTPLEIARVFAGVLGLASAEALGADMDRLFHENAADHAVTVPEAARSLGEMRVLVSSLGIATSDSMAGLEQSMSRTGLLPLFDFKVAYDSGEGLKPGPGMAQAFCREMGLEPAEIAVVGDNPHDMEMGRSAGAALVIGVLTGTSTAADFHGHADRVYPGIAEMARDRELMRMLGR